MAQAVESIAPVIEQLNERVRELESRVAVLEGQRQDQLNSIQIHRPAAIIAARQSESPSYWRALGNQQTSVVPIFGRAVLGIAGAYLLRSIAESGSIPKIFVLTIAIVYAALWMVWATKVHRSNRLAGTTYGVTAISILAPLLWEATIRFEVLSPSVTAIVLVAFFSLTLALSWKSKLQAIPWVVMIAVVSTAFALIIATHELVPLTAALLATALVVEVTTCAGRRTALRVVPALAADISVWLLIDVLTSETVPEGYHPASSATISLLCFSLLIIYGASIGVRTFGLDRGITIFDIGQGVLGLVLACFGVMRASHGAAAELLGLLCLALSAVFYWGALSRFLAEEHTRNRRVSANCAAALFLAASWLLFPTHLRLGLLCIAGVATAFIFTRTRRVSLGVHASFYLAAASVFSSLPSYVGNALGGTVPGAPDWTVWTVAASSALCYLIGSRVQEQRTKRRLLWVFPAIIASFSGISLAVVAAVSLAAAHVELNVSHLSVIRTVVNCSLALALALLGSSWKRMELGWVAYAAVAFGTVKLLFEDFRLGSTRTLMISLFFYGLILIVLPRLPRGTQNKSVLSRNSE